MRMVENECVGCPQGMGCLGSACPHRNVERFYCDECDNEGKLYKSDDGRELCADCILEMFSVVEGSDY